MSKKYAKTTAVIDGDLIAFKAAAAGEERSIRVEHIPTGVERVFKNRTEFKKSVDLSKFDVDDFEITDRQKPDKLENVLRIVKCQINRIMDLSDADDYIVYLGGSLNFRDHLPLPQLYKGQRSDLLKPVRLKDAKDYMIQRYRAKVVNMYEADDAISMRQWETVMGSDIKYIACSIDKDTYGCEGWFLNWDKMTTPFYVTGVGDLFIRNNKVYGYGMKWKALQWLVGDSVDNLKPTFLCGKPFGEKSAYKLLKDLNSQREIYEVVFKQYKKWYPEPVSFIDQCGVQREFDYLDLAQVYFEGIHMLRSEDDSIDIRELSRGFVHE